MTEIKANIQWDCDTDKYNNSVSIVTLANGHKFRMVRHSKPYHKSKRYTVYAGKNKFVKVNTFYSDNDCIENSCEVAGYRVAWGDGDNLGVTNAPLGPDLRSVLKDITEDNFDSVILTVLHVIQNKPEMWMHKPQTINNLSKTEHHKILYGD